MAYAFCVAIGMLLATFIALRQPPSPGLSPAIRARVVRAALLGAVFGAYALEIPAAVWGFGPEGRVDVLPLGGRTILGGLLGGWLAVEWQKSALDVRVATGDGFALPLAVAVACGRVGCMLSGCCAGIVDNGQHLWSRASILGIDGQPRFPTQPIEALFHATAALVVAAAGAGPFDSHVGTLALVNLLVAGVADRLRAAATDRLDRAEAAWQEASSLAER